MKDDSMYRQNIKVETWFCGGVNNGNLQKKLPAVIKVERM